MSKKNRPSIAIILTASFILNYLSGCGSATVTPGITKDKETGSTASSAESTAEEETGSADQEYWFDLGTYRDNLSSNRIAITEYREQYEADVASLRAEEYVNLDFSDCEFELFPEGEDLSVMAITIPEIITGEAWEMIENWINYAGQEEEVDLKSDVIVVSEQLGTLGTDEDPEYYPFYDNLSSLGTLQYGEGAFLSTDTAYMSFVDGGINAMSTGKISSYIRGYDPLTYNYFALGGSSSCFMEDDVMYEAVETANLECFADTGVYLGVTQYRYTERVQAFLFDDETGEITQNPDYDGLNALFELPLDESKADPEKADAIIQWAENQTAETYAEVYLSDIENEEIKMMLAYLETWSMTQEYLEEHAALLQQKTLTPDADHVIHFSYEADGEEHYIDCEVRSLTQAAYTNSITDLFEVLDYEYDEVQGSILIEAVTYNEDGTVTVFVYQAKYIH